MTNASESAAHGFGLRCAAGILGTPLLWTIGMPGKRGPGPGRKPGGCASAARGDRSLRWSLQNGATTGND
eukprot:4748067-Lingulodinium_polyedra.AAC.1